MLNSIFFALVWGALWGIFCGGCHIIKLLDGRDPLSQLMKNALAGGAGYLVAYLLFGAMAHEIIGLMIAITVCIPIENFIRGHLSQRPV